MTQLQLAERLGITPQAVSNGRTSTPRPIYHCCPK
ncbi:MAG: helix-turn-helix transcriptional regulator [Clostridia bacterium]|nr:helix-turn-helix transcriptional regulator [Clostridia bacterium]